VITGNASGGMCRGPGSCMILAKLMMNKKFDNISKKELESIDPNRLIRKLNDSN